MIIDFHNHYYPPEYLAAIEAGRSAIRMDYDADGNPRLYYPGDYNILVPGHRDLDYREGVLDEHRVDMQVATFTTPGTHMETPALAVELARQVNDAYGAELKRRRRFTFLATLPLNDPKASVAELERAMGDLGLPGAMVFSNVNGVALADPMYEPLWRKANELDAVIYIHPAHPLGVEAMQQYWLMPLVGFLFDTTLAAAHLVFAGVPERCPNISWVLCHMGGAIPYLVERLDRGFEAFADCRTNIRRPPSHYLRQFYLDTVNFDPAAIELAIAFAGVDRILAGSDYPHQIGSIPKMLKSIRSLPVAESDKEKILGGNAAALLGIRPRGETEVPPSESPSGEVHTRRAGL
jgi:aminocarboxymuconate-semialdehyde decarboxylase